MLQKFDTLVLGLGAMGAAAAYHLAKSGQRVLGLDRFTPPHTFGSSHGQTRIIREAYFEHPLYVPLVQRAYKLWAELEATYGRRLFLQTGGLMIGPPEGVVFSGARRSAQEHSLAHEILTAAEVRRRFPALRPDDRMMAVWEPRAGILFPETCIEAHLKLARENGAQLLFEQPALQWRPEGAGVHVVTPDAEYVADRLVLTVGAWVNSLLPDFPLRLQVERQILFWFAPRSEGPEFKPERCPI
ncbi:MAG: N-methyl-L-tryptophan oxidase, partial [Verrucomicrobiales bacterium]|nr:N-methyl-L-tryptophan oxidase [Verrucomicrobiales bacterium]